MVKIQDLRLASTLRLKKGRLMSGTIETVIGTVAAMYVASTEWRLRGKVGKDRFADQQVQLNRLESHLWDMMKAGNIKATIEPPDEIKNNKK